MPDEPAANPEPPPGGIPRSDAEVEGLAAVDANDIADADAYWREHAPAEYRGLIDAEPDDEEEANR